MNLGELISKLLPITEQLISPGGVEGKLSQQRFRKKFALIIAFTGFILQFIVGIFNKDSIKNFPTYLANFIDFANLLLRGNWSLALRQYEIVVDLSGIFILFIGLSIYLFFSIRSSLKEYSEEPFQYTFWIEPFKHIKDTEKEQVKIEHEDRFHHLLHHDLMEKLNKRIRRLSLLDASKLDDAAKKNLVSHINIEGHYTIRKIKDDECVIHVMPRIRMGPPDNPATLANPIKYKLDDHSINLCKLELVETNKYNQIIERIYSNIATGIYKQIKTDLKEKINLFPTKYLRAVALYYEAEDFARSNTIDAYDYAIELYKESLRYFDITAFDRLTQYFIKFPVLWRYGRKFQHMLAKVEIGYAKCLIYRREISALSGRYKNPLFGIRDRLNEVIDNLSSIHDRINQKWNLSEKKEQNRLHTIMAFLTFPKDSWWRRILLKPNQTLFERQNHLLFDAYLVFAYAHNLLGAVQKAVEYLDNAKAVDPQLSEKSALYHLVAGAIEPDVNKALLLFRQATEIAPDFQMAQYLLAYYSEMKFRIQEKIGKDRVKSVIDEYDKVLELNPGNIASLAAQGYLYWLLGDLNKAKKKFEDGCEVKTISQQTFIGQLNYGLARIAAEEDDFNESYDKYNEAISSDPGVGVYSITTSSFYINSLYDYIGFNMLKRYEKFRENVEAKVNNNKDKLVNKVYSYVLNDYGNACLNYFHNTGEKVYLQNAIEVFEESTKMYPQNKITFYNLSNAYEWNFETDKSIECLKKADKLEWHVTSIALAQTSLRQGKELKKRIEEEKKNKEKELNEKELKQTKKELYTPQSSKASAGSTGVHSQQPTIRNISDKESEELEAKIKSLKEEIEKLSEKGEKITFDYIEIGKVVNSIIKKTKISPIYTGYEFNTDGRGVNEFLSKKDKIKKDKFDESDIEALRVWAELLSHNDENPKAQNKAEDILEYILKEYFPENFDVLLPLHDMNMRIIKDMIVRWLEDKDKKDRIEKIQEYRKKILEYRKIIKPIIDSWDKQGLRRYATSRWRESFSEEDIFVSVILDVLKEKEDIRNPSELFNNKIKKMSILIDECCGSAGFSETQESQCNKEQAKFFNGVGNLFFNIFKVSESIPYYKKAVELALHIAVYHENLGGAYKGLKQWEEAEQSYLEAIKLEPKNAGYHNTLGNMYWEISDWEKAINEYTEAFELDKQPIYLCNRCRAYGNLGQYDKMIEYCGRAVELRRETLTDAFGLDYYYEFLAEAYFRDNRLPEFEKLFEKSDDLKEEEKKKAIIYNRIGNLLVQGGQVIESITYYEKAISLDDKWPIYECNLGLTYGKLPTPDWDKMIEHCQRAVELRRDAPTDPYGLDYYYDFLAEAYFRAGKLKEFEDEFEKLGDLKNEPKKEARIYNRIGNLLAKGQKEQEAIIYYEKAIELDSESPIYECNLGLTYGKLSKPDLDKMIEHYNRAVDLSRRMPDEYGLGYYYEYLAEGYFKANRLREFEDLFEKSEDLKDKPEEKARIYNRIGNLFFETYENKKSIPYYKKATELAPAIAVYYANLGGTYRELKQWDESNEAYLTAVKIEPNNAGYHNSLGNIYYEIGNWEEAKKSYAMAIELDNQPIFLCNLGRAYGNLGQLNEMIKYCSKAVELRRTTPTDAFGLDYYYAFLAEGYFNAGRLEEFEKFFEKSGDLKNEPDKKAIVYNQIGNLFFNTRKVSESIPYYKRATELAPGVAVYHSNLGGSYRALKQLDEAIKEYELAIEKAMKINPDDKTFHQYLSLIYNDRGVEYYNKQEDYKAIEDYKKAIELNDHDPVIYHNLYLAYFAKGMYKEAKEAINKALALSPDNQTFSQALNTLMSKGI